MKIESHSLNDISIAEVISDQVVIHTIDDGVSLLGHIYYQGFDHLVLHAKNITPEFFNLSSGIAGEVLQKFSNYRVKLAIVGDLSKYTSKSLTDFIYESNKGRHITFVSTISEAIKMLSSS